jgi:RNA polymerase sigma-70 factor (ECF subfamily)
MKDRVLERLFLRWRAKGDGRALAAVFDLCSRELLGVAAHLVGGLSEAEDVLQMTFLRAMERAATYDPGLGLRGWLHGILWREAAALRRRRARTTPLPEPGEFEGGTDPAEALAQGELPGLVRDALDGLPRVYREVLGPYLLEEQKPAEIAARLGRSPGTIRTQLVRGLERLRSKLPRRQATLGVLGMTRGLGRVRSECLAKAGLSAAPGPLAPLATGALVAWSALAATPVLWPVPLSLGAGALAMAGALPLPFHSTGAGPVEPSTDLVREDPAMKTPLLVTLAALAPTGAGRQPPASEVVALETVADKAAALDALVAELLELSQPGQPEADVAWQALLRARNLIQQEERARRIASQPTSASLRRIEEWTEAVSQIADPGLRAQALQEITAALAGGDPDLQLAACRTLTACGQVEFDKAPFRSLLLPFCEAATGDLRVAALYALFHTWTEPQDRALVLALADDHSEAARTRGPHLLMLYFQRDLTGEAGAAALQMFQGSTYDQRRSMLGGIWGGNVSPELEQYVLDLSHSEDREDRYDAMYYSLSTFDPKSEAVVERLIEYLPSSVPDDYGRALWGLSWGVQPEQQPRVVEVAQGLFEARSDVSIQTECLGLIGSYAEGSLVPWLAGIAGDTGRPQAVREAAENAREAIESR